ncbi:MAG: hypothetical protein MRJ96_14215 [Nitrospirales bacterium]|nr:hypothetical protein [Nitrospira sp.]MDR4502596.1 hypothetical protein [Nitrospirales bacterium]
MPNTLAHLGVQGVLTKLAVPQADLKLVFLGCLLPDIPWIIRRAVVGLDPGVDLYSLKLYAITQSSLFMTLVLCGALAGLSRTPGRAFGILGSNAVLHLVLDAIQIKWANGVHLVAPFSWVLCNVGWFWPESLPTYLLTGFGLGYVFWRWKEALAEPLSLATFSTYRIGLCLIGLTVYLMAPFVFLHEPFMHDNHYVRTFQERNHRIDRPVEADRRPYTKGVKNDVINVFGEDFVVRGAQLAQSGMASIRGRFVQEQVIEVWDIHAHSTWFREWSSCVGIFAVGSIWLIVIIRHLRMITQKTHGASRRSQKEGHVRHH